MERGNKLLKKIDRYAGVPLIWLMGKLRLKKRSLPLEIQRIAIIKGAAIGDTVLLSAIVQDIREQLPAIELVMFCGQTCFEIAKLIPGIDSVILMPTTDIPGTIQILHSRGRFNIVIDAGPWTRLEALFTYLTPGDYKIGFKSIRQYRHFALDKSVVHSNEQHELENNRNLVRPFLQNPHRMPVLKFEGGTPEVVEQAIIKAGLKKPFWILHAWSGGYKGHYKEWMTKRWVELAGWLTSEGYDVAFSGAKANGPQTQKLVDECSAQGISVINLAGKTSFSELFTLIHASEGVISVNTGVLHIAAALGAYVIGLNGPVPSLRWGAASDRAINVDADDATRPYIHLGFEYPVNPPDCMGSISVAGVQKAVQQIIQLKEKEAVS